MLKTGSELEPLLVTVVTATTAGKEGKCPDFSLQLMSILSYFFQ